MRPQSHDRLLEKILAMARLRHPLSEFAGAMTRERTSTTTSFIKHHAARAPDTMLPTSYFDSGIGLLVMVR
jgi:hypothetical protein